VQLVERELVVHEPLQLLQRRYVLLGLALEFARVTGREREDLGHVHPGDVVRVEPADLR
jgi:hypothetical protein